MQIDMRRYIRTFTQCPYIYKSMYNLCKERRKSEVNEVIDIRF